MSLVQTALFNNCAALQPLSSTISHIAISSSYSPHILPQLPSPFSSHFSIHTSIPFLSSLIIHSFHPPSFPLLPLPFIRWRRRGREERRRNKALPIVSAQPFPRPESTSLNAGWMDGWIAPHTFRHHMAAIIAFRMELKLFSARAMSHASSCGPSGGRDARGSFRSVVVKECECR